MPLTQEERDKRVAELWAMSPVEMLDVLDAMDIEDIDWSYYQDAKKIADVLSWSSQDLSPEEILDALSAMDIDWSYYQDAKEVADTLSRFAQIFIDFHKKIAVIFANPHHL